MKYKIQSLNSNRGFFSDLIHGILPSVIFLHDNSIMRYNIEWYNNLYQNETFNLYDYFFEGNISFDEYDKTLHLGNCPYGTYFTYENSHDKLLRGYEIINEIKLLQSNFFKELKPPFDRNKKILGVQQRKTDHGSESKIIDDRHLIEIVKSEFKHGNFEEIFLITDSQKTLNIFKEEFDISLRYNDSVRSFDDRAVHYQSHNIIDKLKLAQDVLSDSYFLGLTEFKLICHSNVSTFSIMSNYIPGNFKYIDK
jgi:hypothetical protein